MQEKTHTPPFPALPLLYTKAFEAVDTETKSTVVPYLKYLHACIKYLGLGFFPKIELQSLEYWLKEWRDDAGYHSYIHNLDAYVELNLLIEKEAEDEIGSLKYLFEKLYPDYDDPHQFRLINAKKIQHLQAMLAILTGVHPNNNRVDYLAKKLFSALAEYSEHYCLWGLAPDRSWVAQLLETCIALNIYCTHREGILLAIRSWLISSGAELLFTTKQADEVLFRICHSLLEEEDFAAINAIHDILPEKKRYILFDAIFLLESIPKPLLSITEEEQNQERLLVFSKLMPKKLFPEKRDFRKSMDNFLEIMEDKYLLSFLEPYYRNYLASEIGKIPEITVDILNYLHSYWGKMRHNKFTAPLIKYIDKEDLAFISFELRMFVINMTKYKPNVEVLIPLFENISPEEQGQLLEVVQHTRYGEEDLLIKLFIHQGCNFKVQLPDRENEDELFIPTPLYIAMINADFPWADESVSEAFSAFYTGFKKANDHNIGLGALQNVVNYNEFMVENIRKLLYFYEFMGDDLFLFLKKKIKTSVLALQRYFNNLLIFPNSYLPLFKQIIAKYRDDILKNANSHFDTLLLQISQFQRIISQQDSPVQYKFFKQAIIEELLALLDTSTTPEHLEKLIRLLNKNTWLLYKKLLNIPSGCKTNFSIFEADPFLLSQLLIGRATMQENALSDVFDKLIEADIRTDSSFNAFSSNTHQDNPLGKRLALHNRNIADELRKNGINPAMTFHYTRQKQFYTASDENSEQIIDNLCSDLKTLANTLSTSTFNDKSTPLIQNIKTAIEKINKQIEREKSTKCIASGRLNKPLNTISKNLNLLVTTNIQIPDRLIEVNFRFSELLEKLIKSQKKISVKIPKKEFLVKQWDKNQIETFLLGDYFSCCLATDGTQFPGIVQRRMDAAMVMHVIYDTSVQKPICGNWLFLGYDKKNPKDFYVIVNFIEIRASYALNEALRDILVAELLAFTAQYAKDIGAKGVLMRPLTYGLIPDFEGQYAKKNICVNKAGGFFSPEETGNHPVHYYLNALKINKFYVYSPPGSEEKMQVEQVPFLNNQRQRFFQQGDADVILEGELPMHIDEAFNF